MTQEAKHTLGPWDFIHRPGKDISEDEYCDPDCEPYDLAQIVIASGNKEIAERVFDDRPHKGKTRSNAEELANARLIAAAPDYYEGCKDLPQIQDDEPTADYDKRVLAWFYCNAGKIHAANIKAKGTAA